MTLLAATLLTAALMGAGGSQASTCVIHSANGDSHSGTSQQFAVALERSVTAVRTLSLAQTNGAFDIEFYLVRAPANNIRDYPKDDRFRVFYVLKSQEERFISADVLSCSGNGSECAASAARRLVEACARRPNSSFKPKPLRGSA